MEIFYMQGCGIYFKIQKTAEMSQPFSISILKE